MEHKKIGLSIAKAAKEKKKQNTVLTLTTNRN